MSLRIANIVNYLFSLLSSAFLFVYFLSTSIVARFKRSEFKITETELKLIAAAAIIGDNRMPKLGYRSPAAKGMPKIL
ncbi:hypothetical protein D3C80_1588030 [compost metagenome]